MDLLDSEPYLRLLPRRLASALGIAAIVVLAVHSPSRLWLIEQAEHHVAHRVQPMIDGLINQSSPSPPAHGGE